MIVAQVLRSLLRNEFDVASIVDSALVAVDCLVLLILPRKPTRFVTLEADLIDIDGITDDGCLESELYRVGRGWNAVLEQLHVDVLHQLHRILFGVMIDFEEVCFVLAALEQVASIAALPRSVVEANEGCINAHLRSSFVHFVSVAWTDSTHQRDPAGELPLHLDVEVRRVLQFREELGDLDRPSLLPPKVAETDD